MAGSNDINVKVSFHEEARKLKSLRDQGIAEGAFKGPNGSEGLTRINNGFKVLDKLTEQGEITEKNGDEANDAVKNIYQDLLHFAARAVKISPALDKLYKSLTTAEERLKTESERIVKAHKEQGAVKTKLSDLAKTQGISFHKVSSQGKVNKGELTNIDTVFKNYDAHTLAIKKGGQEIKDQAAIDAILKDLSEEYRNQATVITTANKEIESLSGSIATLNKQILAQVNLEKASGGQSSDYLAKLKTAESSYTTTASQDVVGKARTQSSKQDLLAGFDKIATPQAGAGGQALKAISLYSLAIKGLRTALSAAKNTVVELDKYLTEQAMVTGKTREETYQLIGAYQELALQCGATTKEIAQVATEYMKQGKSTAEALVLTEAAVKAAKVASVSVGDSVNYLTTALNGFRLSSDQAMAVSDKFAAVAAASATDYDELAIALSKVASQANLAGMSIDYTTALLTKGLETTREAPETMGTALKTIIARMREMSDYGETLDDGMDINNVESQLQYVGIALRDANGELRSTEDVLDELGNKGDTLNKNQQAAIAKALAGTRQQSRLIAMMDDYERVTELQQISERSAGATTAQADVYLEGMAGAINKVQTAGEKVVSAFTDSNIIIKIINAASDGLQVIGDILGSTAGQVSVLGTVASIGFVILGNKMKESALAKEQHKLELQIQSVKNQQLILNKEKAIKDAEILQTNRANHIEDLKEKITEKEKLKTDLQRKILKEQEYQANFQNIIQSQKDLANNKEELLTEQKITLEKLKQNAAQEQKEKGQVSAETAKALADKEQEVSTTEQERNTAQQKHDDMVANSDKYIQMSKNREKGYANQIADIDASIEADTKELNDTKAAYEEGTKQIELEKQSLDLLQEQQTLLEGQLDPIQRITSGITGGLSPLTTAGKRLTSVAKFMTNFKKNVTGIGKSFKKSFEPITKTFKKTTKDIKKYQKQKKKGDKEDIKNTKKKVKETKKEGVARDDVNKKIGDSNVNKAKENALDTENLNTKKEGIEVKKDDVKQTQEVVDNKVLEQNTTKDLNAVEKTGVDIQNAENTAETKGVATGTKEIAVNNAQATSEKKEAEADMNSALAGAADNAAETPGVGWIIALAILALLGITAIAVGASMALANVNGAFDNDYGAQKRAEEINKLSGEIYELTSRAQALDTITDSFEKIDDKVIKTKEDLEEMNSLLEQAGDELSDEIGDDEDIGYGKGVSAKEAYNALTREQDKVAFLEAEAQRNRDEANKKRDEQLKIFNNARAYERSKLLYGTESQYVNARSAIYGINNNTLYERVDALKETTNLSEEALTATEDLVQAMLEELDIETALNLANEAGNETINKLVQELSDLKAAETFLNEEESFINRVKAFQELTFAMSDNQEMLEALKTAYSEGDAFANMNDDILTFIDNTGLSIEKINELYAGYNKLNKLGLNISKEAYHATINNVLTDLDEDLSNFDVVMERYFGYLRDEMVGTTEEIEEAGNAMISAIGDQFAVSMLDMGQNLEAFQNTINNFYDTAANGASKTASERMEFIADNAELFSGEGGDNLLSAFESGQYNLIEAALSQQMEERTAEQLAQVRRTLRVEEARVGDDRNEAYIKALKDYEEYLMDGNQLYKASLELRLEQEENQLSEYKEFLEAQQEALSDSLEKRKEAYEKYFDAINQEKEAEDFEEEAERLMANISKLSSSTSADAMQKRAELEQELAELEKERLETLREQAQEAVIEDIDDQINEINDKFDKLLESNQALLVAMTNDLNNPSEFLSELIGNKIASGATELELEQYLQDLEGVYGSLIGADAFDQIDVREENGTLILNVNGQDIEINEGDQQTVYAAVMKALQQIGIR